MFDEQAETAFYEQHIRDMAVSAAQRMKDTCPVKTGELRNSIEAQGTEIVGNAYGLIVDRKYHKFISESVTE